MQLTKPPQAMELRSLSPVFAGHEGTQRKGTMKKIDAPPKAQSATRLIDARIKSLVDWRGDTLSRIRRLIKTADPDVVEEWKWDVPVWSHGGLICTGETYRDVVKLTFAKGAELKDPSGLFNSSLGGKVRRAIDIREGEELDAPAFKTLIRNAVALNTSASAGRRSRRTRG